MTPRPLPLHADPRQRGVSLVEASIVVFILGVMSVLIVESARGLTSTQAYSEGQTRIVDLAERCANAIAKDANFSVRLFTAGASGTAYLDRMDLDELSIPVSCALPRATSIGLFEADPVGEVETGNVLFLARGQATERVDLSGGLGTDIVRLDVSRFVLWFPRPTANDVIELSRWGSRPCARYQDLAAVDDPNRRSQVVIELVNRGIAYAWDRDADAATGLFKLGKTGTIDALESNAKVLGDQALTEPDLLAPRRVGVARNGVLKTIDVPRFAAAQTEFPNGFEIKVDGVGSGQLALVRLVLMSPDAIGKRRNFAEVVRLIPLRDG